MYSRRPITPRYGTFATTPIRTRSCPAGVSACTRCASRAASRAFRSAARACTTPSARRIRAPASRPRWAWRWRPSARARAATPWPSSAPAHSSPRPWPAGGLARAAKEKGESRHTVAIIGDGAMSAGMAFEALNNAGVADCNLLVVLNDNDMSISPPVGALNRYLAQLMSGRFYAAAKNMGKTVLRPMPPLLEFAKRFEQQAKGLVVPATLFEKFGFNYIGPIDGHDLDSLIPTLDNIKGLQGPQFLHVVTKKGQGYKLAEADPVAYHGPARFDPAVGLVKSSTAPRLTFTQVFGQWLCDMAAHDQRL